MIVLSLTSRAFTSSFLAYFYNSRVKRNPAFSICENKGADHRLCSHYIDGTILLLPKSEILTIICDCTVRFVSDLVGKPEDMFSRDEAHIKSYEPFYNIILVEPLYERISYVTNVIGTRNYTFIEGEAEGVVAPPPPQYFL